MCRLQRYAALISIGVALSPPVACTREPGQAASYLPGITLGIPVAANPPPGFYMLNQANYYNASITHAVPGEPEGPDISVTVESVKLIWSTPWTILGATEMMFVIQPFVDTQLSGTSGASQNKAGLANTGFEPINLSWRLSDNFYVATMLGFYTPAPDYHRRAAINVGNNFWTIQPEIGISYVGLDLDLTLHAADTVNSANKATNYRSGNQLFVDATATKKIGHWEFGLVGYYDKQLTGDKNDGGFYPRSMVMTRPMRVAVGPLVGYSRGKIDLQIYVTRDVTSRQAAPKGTHFWTTVSLPL